jgi:D-alanine-D-alanine ligase
LRLDGYARFDYILDDDNNFWCLEANTLPGMTPTSLLPQEAAAVGIDYGTLCDKIAKMALNKKGNKK